MVGLGVAAFVGVLLPFFSWAVNFRVLAALLLVRTFVDGPLSFDIAGQSASSLLGMVILVAGASLMIRNKQGLLLGSAVLACLAASTLLAGFTQQGFDGWPYFLRVASLIAFGLAFANLPRPAATRSVLALVQTVAVASAGFSFAQAATGTGMVVEGVVRPAGLLAHPNSAALVYGMGALASLALLREPKHRVLNVLVLAVLLAALLMTGSIGGIVAFLSMVSAFAFLSREVPFGAKVSLLAVSAVSFALFTVSPVGLERLSAFTSIDVSGASGERNSLEWRFGRWRELLEYWQTSPVFGLGYGRSTSGGLLPGGYPPHNEYLRVLVDTGLVGLTIALIFAVSLWAFLNRLLRTTDSTDRRLLPGIAVATLVGLLVNSFTENTFTYSIPIYLFGAILGSVWAAGLPDRLPQLRGEREVHLRV